MKWNRVEKLCVLSIAGCLATISPMYMTTVAYAATTTVSFDSIRANNKLLTFNFQNIDIRVLLQLIAKNSGLNFIIGDAVKGTVTLNLKNVTWRSALDILLKTHALASRRIGNVIYISTIEEITTNESKQLQAQETLANLSPLRSILIHLKYTSAANVAALLKGEHGTLLSTRGEVAVDSRTNSLIIRDTASRLAVLESQIRQLDIPARQVLIEARIVNIDTIYEEEIGVRFGVTAPHHLSGTLSGANQITNGITPGLVTPFTDRLNFDNPANELFSGGNPGTIGLALGRLGNFLIDLELSALEGERHAQIIASPRVVTSNQEKALIQTGEEIPYQESTSSGATSVVFKKAVLSLEITPQITPNNKIILRMKATEDTRGENIAVGSSGGIPLTVPAINTQEVQSNVLLDNNETIVIGGVYRQMKQNTIDRIPFFGTLPGIGALFRHTGVHNEKRELLIFVTPKIVTASPAATIPYKGEVG